MRRARQASFREQSLSVKSMACYIMRVMSTLTEIEAAVAALPRRDQRKLLKRLATQLEGRLKRASKKTPSLHDRMKDLCGVVDSGIPDLGSNKKHLAGLGRRA